MKKQMIPEIINDTGDCCCQCPPNGQDGWCHCNDNYDGKGNDIENAITCDLVWAESQPNGQKKYFKVVSGSSKQNMPVVLPTASLTKRGVVQLTNDLSDREDLALTPKVAKGFKEQLDREAADRVAKDTDLQNQINKEKTDRANADNALSNRITSAESKADSALTKASVAEENAEIATQKVTDIIASIEQIKALRENNTDDIVIGFSPLNELNAHFAQAYFTYIDKLLNMGCKIMRVLIVWDTIERQNGVYDFSVVDRELDLCVANNIELYLNLTFSNQVHSITTFPTTTEEINAYNNFASALANHIKAKYYSGAYYEPFNEPNLEGASAEQYMNILKGFYTTVKNVDSSSHIIGCCTSSLDIKFIKQCLNLDLVSYCDGISFHPYTSSPEDWNNRIKSLRNTVGTFTNRKLEFIISEIGYATLPLNNQFYATDNDRGIFLCRWILNSLANGVSKVIIHTPFTSMNDTSNLEEWMGVLDYRNGNLTESATILTNFYTMISGLKYVGIYDEGTNFCILQMVNTSGEYKYIGWSYSNNFYYVNKRGYSTTLTTIPTICNIADDNKVDNVYRNEIKDSSVDIVTKGYGIADGIYTKLSDITASGTYSIGDLGNFTDKPSWMFSTSYTCVLVVENGNGFIKQIISNGIETYDRIKIDGTWSKWVKLANNDDEYINSSTTSINALGYALIGYGFIVPISSKRKITITNATFFNDNHTDQSLTLIGKVAGGFGGQTAYMFDCPNTGITANKVYKVSLTCTVL